MRSIGAHAIRNISAVIAFFGITGGCIAIYGFDDFEKKPPIKCTKATDCPGSDACGQRICEGGLCKIVNPVQAGLYGGEQVRGDCQRQVCDGNGVEVVEVDDDDVPVDGINCTEDLCTSGSPSNLFFPEGTKCGTLPQLKCNSGGACVGCDLAADCGVDTACAKWLCESATCLRLLEPIGKPASDPAPGDCQRNYCNAIGEETEAFAADDAPDDGNPCTKEVCTPEGIILKENLPDGTSCGECQVCMGGVCGACDLSTTTCYEGKCFPKSVPCTQASDCVSKYCVDGYCCDSECQSTCTACSNELTGAPSGVCALVKSGTDPQNDCNSPAEDVCVDGICQCTNGILDVGETGTDCGGKCGPCSGMWDCGGTAACNGAVAPACCNDQCDQCFDNNAQVCNGLQGQPCVLGSPPIQLTLGLAPAGNCPWWTGCKSTTCTCK